MKMRKIGSYDGKELYKSADGTMWTKGDGDKVSKLGDEYDKSKLSKAEKEGDEEDLDAEEEAEKSITAEDLRKSLDALVNFGAGSDRKTELLQKAQTGLTEEENQELYGLLGGSTETGESLAKSATEHLDGPTSQAAFDVAPFLEEQHAALTKSLGTLADAIEGSAQREHEFNMVLARAVADVGSLVKSMAEGMTSDFEAIRQKLGIIESQPVRAPKSVGIQGAQPMDKSFGELGEEGSGPFDGMTKAQVADTLDEMAKSGVNAVGGTSIMNVMARLESVGSVTRPEMDAINEYKKTAAA